MLEKNNLIVIYGKAGSYKSSLGVSLLNNYDNSCYINLEKNSHIKINDSIKVFSEDGFSLFNEGKWIIYINDITTGYERQNNTFLHEIGHIVLNHTEDSELADSEANFFAKYIGSTDLNI